MRITTTETETGDSGCRSTMSSRGQSVGRQIACNPSGEVMCSANASVRNALVVKCEIRHFFPPKAHTVQRCQPLACAVLR
ncbi:hypothetical protein V5799_007986 [Amblyomma americanum]|uniref:Uncharacterized protein n=1 Tax=Amblyomma americanum TaxID=6943 RepID=A0AAQ4FEJ8_AMBAM